MDAVGVALAVAFGVAALFALGLATVVRSYRDKPGSTYVLAHLLFVALWSGGALATMLVGSLWAKGVFNALTFAGGTLAAPMFALYVLVYTGHDDWLDRATIVLIVPSVLFVLLFWTDPIHGLAFSGQYVHEGTDRLMNVPGPLFLAWVVFVYAIQLSVFSLLTWHLFTAQRFYRRQIGALILANLAPVVATLVYALGLVPIELGPLGYVVTGVVLTGAIARGGLIDIAPIARDVVVETVDAGVLVVDTAGRIVDANPQAEVVLEDGGDSVIGRQLSTALAGDGDLEAAFASSLAAGGEDEFTIDAGDRHLRVDVATIENVRATVVGQVFLVTDVTEEHRRQRELERQNEQLEEFASIVSHDLRNPLTVARGRAELLADEAGEDDENVAPLTRALERMDAIIDDVLTLAREGQAVVETDVLTVDEVARAAWASVDTGDATLDAATSMTVEADRSRLIRVFENLFRNAVEHGSPSPSGDGAEPAVAVRVVAIEGPEDAGPVGFAVEDDGPGIPPDERDDVFESGYSDSRDGTGFGLSIVRRIVEAHGWSVRAIESESGGARFEITGVASEPQAVDAVAEGP